MDREMVRGREEAGEEISREGCFYGGAFQLALPDPRKGRERCPGTFSQSKDSWIE